MSLLTRLRGGWRALRNKERSESELHEELESFLAESAAAKMREGLTPQQALRAARMEAGALEGVKEEVRSVGWESLAESIWQDLRYGIRNLRSHPGFSAIAILSLAIAIGANTALFSLIDEVLLKSLPVRHAEELVLFSSLDGQKSMRVATNGVTRRDPATGRTTTTSFSYRAFEQMRHANQTLAGMFAFAPLEQVNVVADGAAEVATGQLVTGDYYRTLGVEAVIGRTLSEDDDRQNAAPVAVISWRYFQRRFGGNARVLGKRIVVANIPCAVVGVSPPGFEGTLQVGESPDVTLPMAVEPRFDEGSRNDLDTGWYWFVRVMGRLKPGVTMEQARQQLEPVFRRAALEGYQQALTVPRFRTRLEPRQAADAPQLQAAPGAQGLRDVRREYGNSIRVLTVMVVLVLAIACANVANLLLARATVREREMQVRLALGAARHRLIRQLLTESILLAVIAGAAGLLIAYATKDALLVLHPWSNPGSLELRLDWRVLAFTMAVSLATGIVFGLAPALCATRTAGAPSLKQAGMTGVRGRSILGKALVAVQVAISVLLLVSAGLFIRTLNNLNHVALGFNADNLVDFRVNPRMSGYRDEQLNALYSRILERLRTVPGVTAASLSRQPLLSFSSRNGPIFTAGQRPQNTTAYVHVVSPSFLATMGVPLLAGRGLTDRDDEKSPKVAVINELMARQFFPNGVALGQRFWFGDRPEGESYEIVGIVRDSKYTDLRSPIPATIYCSFRQERITQANFEVRTSMDAGAAASSIRAAIHDIDPNLPIFDVKTQREYAESTVSQERLFARFSGAFGTIALALAAIGLYGLMSYGVARRTGEIGVRMALGARARAVVWMVLRETLVLVALGGLAGGLASAGAFRVAKTQLVDMLYGVRPGDPVTALIAAGVLVAVALMAAYVPARRAAAIDPMVALRQD